MLNFYHIGSKFVRTGTAIVIPAAWVTQRDYEYIFQISECKGLWFNFSPLTFHYSCIEKFNCNSWTCEYLILKILSYLSSPIPKVDRDHRRVSTKTSGAQKLKIEEKSENLWCCGKTVRLQTSRNSVIYKTLSQRRRKMSPTTTTSIQSRFIKKRKFGTNFGKRVNFRSLRIQIALWKFIFQDLLHNWFEF